MLLKSLHTGASLYRSASSFAGKLLHPVRASQDMVRNYLVKKVAASVLAIAGPRISNALTHKLGQGHAFRLHVGVPRRAAKLLTDAETLALLQNLINDALAAPLSVLGLRVGELAIRPDDTGLGICIDGEFKLTSLTALPALKAA